MGWSGHGCSRVLIRTPFPHAAAIRSAKTTKLPIELIVKTGDRFRVLTLDYHDGLRYPHLEREPSTPARLDDILAARK